MALRFCSETSPGRRRTVNQDALLTDPSLQLFVVADGMGGHKDGHVAARLVVEGMRDFFEATGRDRDKTWPFATDPHLGYAANRLRAAVLVANRLVGERAGGAANGSMGATLVAAVIGADRAVFAHVGDCRAYLLDETGVRQLTRDHSWVADQVEAGFFTAETARAHPWRNMVTRAVQGGTDLAVDTREIVFAAPSRLLLCSDGLHSVVNDDEIARILRESPAVDGICERLVRAANDRGAPDNVSVIVIDWTPEP
jgi:serine/threonine protein phosphatase PrpC